MQVLIFDRYLSNYLYILELSLQSMKQQSSASLKLEGIISDSDTLKVNSTFQPHIGICDVYFNQIAGGFLVPV